MAREVLVDEDSKYVDADGKMVKNDWVKISDDEDNDGSMKTGSQKVTVDGDEYDFYFCTKTMNKGQGITGKQGNKYYYNGKKIAADDSVADYLFYPYADPEDKTYVDPTVGLKFKDLLGTVSAEEYVLISKNGTIAKSGTKKDGNGYKATYKSGNWVISAE